MRKIFAILGILAACVPLIALSWGGQEKSSAGDEQAIRETVAVYADAFNRGDLTALAAVWAPDAEYIDEAGKTTKGREAIAALFKQFLTNRKGSKMALKVTNLRLLKGDVALQDGTSTMTGTDGTADDGKFTAVWFKEDGKWRIRSARDLPYDVGDVPGAGGPLKDLQWRIGTWTTEKGGVEVNVRTALNKAFLLMDYRTKQGSGELEVRQLIGFDPLTGQIKSWQFDSNGGYGEGLWSRDGNSWVVEAVGVLSDGQTGSGFNVLRFVNEQSFVFQSRDRQVGGQPIADSEVKLVRKPAAQ